MTAGITSADGKNSRSFSEGIIGSIWQPGSVVDVDDARASILAVELSGGIPVPLLVELTDEQVSAAAPACLRRRTVRHCRGSLVGTSVVDRVASRGPCSGAPSAHKFFSSRQDAVAWLRG
jgi:hypothetical protein